MRIFSVAAIWLMTTGVVWADHGAKKLEKRADVCGGNGPNFDDGDHAVLPASDKIHAFDWLAHGVMKDRPDDNIKDGYIISLEKQTSENRMSKKAHQAPYLCRHSEMQRRPGFDVYKARIRDRWTDSAFGNPKLQVVTHTPSLPMGPRVG